jgi:hypothetical protein
MLSKWIIFASYSDIIEIKIRKSTSPPWIITGHSKVRFGSLADISAFKKFVQEPLSRKPDCLLVRHQSICFDDLPVQNEWSQQ